MRIALAQVNPTVGDLDGNLAKAQSAATEAAAAGAQLIVFPAHALTGVPLDGLLTSAAFVADALDHLARFAESCPILALVSGITVVEPDEDDEDADDDEAFCSSAIYLLQDGEPEILAVPDLADDDECPVIEIDGESVAVLVEEHFAPDLELGGINMLVEMSADAYGEQEASSAAWGTLERSRSLTTTCHCNLAVVNLCGASDGMVFAGGSYVMAPDAKLVHACPVDEEEIFIYDTQDSNVATLDPKSCELNPNELLWRGLVTATRDYVKKNGFTDVLVGLSGGIDSSVVATIAVDALGAEHVHGILMPSAYSSEGSLTDAKKLAENLGIPAPTVPINDVVESFEGALADVCDGGVTGLAAENLQARIRAVYLMTVSNTFGYLVLNTGNKSEAAMGFSTLFGDTVGVFAPIGDIYKTDVYDLARWRMEQGESIPQECIDKAPSAELYPGATDQDRLPPYAELDDLLFDHVEGNMDAGELLHEGHSREMIAKVLPVVKRSEFKRRLEPLAPKVQGRSFTKDRAWPITNGWVDDSYDKFEDD